MKNFKRMIFTGLIMILVLAVAAACAQTTPAPDVEAPKETRFTMAGSTTVQPLAEILAETFMANNADVRVDVQGGGSSVGVKAAGQKTADIGMASREIKDSEFTEFPNINVIVLARDGIAIVTHPEVGVGDLTIEQIKGIFGGTITNWREVGGEDSSIIVVSREEGSGTRAAFEEMVLGEEVLITENAILQPSNGSIRTTVSTTTNSIGYISFGYLGGTMKSIRVEGVAPTEANASNGTYPLVRSLNLITFGEPTGELKVFIDFMLSPTGQQVVVDEGYLPVK
ncbi:MAG: phosphate ABC transporter substrate-binding protein [Chloroflexi bacterium]|nr:phosphate ABC transporter substrate-binding protein [Chloroflexota bacterium]